MRLIEVTDLSGKKILINPAYILKIEPTRFAPQVTTITLARGGLFGTPGSVVAKETMAQIQAMISETTDV
jgi:uncharacterized protein YlzI (FlbEa/FlbD family)